MPDPSHICDLQHSSWQRCILNSMSEARDWTCKLMVPSQSHFRCAMMGTPRCVFLMYLWEKVSVTSYSSAILLCLGIEFLTHCTGPGIKSGTWHFSWILNPLCHSRNNYFGGSFSLIACFGLITQWRVIIRKKCFIILNSLRIVMMLKFKILHSNWVP